MLNLIKPLLNKTWLISFDLLKIMIPIIFVMKLIVELGLLTYISSPFKLVMYFVGLPQEYSIVWLSAMANGNHSAFLLISNLFNNHPINVAQLTSIALLCLICHNLIMETIIAKELGLKPLWAILLRFLSALLSVFVFYKVCNYFNFLTSYPTSLFFNNNHENINILMFYIKDNTLSDNFFLWANDMWVWLLVQIKMIIVIILMIFFIFLVLEILKYFKIIDLCNKIIYLLFQLITIKKNNSLILLVCLLLGLSYGWGILREENEKNVFFQGEQRLKVLSFLLISHDMIEDIFLFSILGASFWLMFIFRFLLSFCVVGVLSFFILPRLSNNIKNKIFFTKNSNLKV
jgi:hypothetical protein